LDRLTLEIDMKMDIEYVIRGAVRGLHAGKNSEEAAGVVGAEKYLPSCSKDTKALYMAFDIRGDYYGGMDGKPGKRSDISCSLHFLFHRAYGSEGFCATHTFGGWDESPFAHEHDVKHWEFLSSHDSCWIDAARDYIWKWERELYKDLRKQSGLSESEFPCMNDISWFITPSWVYGATDFYKWVDVHMEKDPQDEHRYQEIIKVL
jgi:hypothetical protein